MTADRPNFKPILPIEGSFFTDKEKGTYLIWKYHINWDLPQYPETHVEVINVTSLKKRVLPISELADFLKGKDPVEVGVVE
jgi:hypothetical protein